MPDLISADLRSSEASAYRGCIDGFEPDTGLLGWAIALDEPSKSLIIRFFVDNMLAIEVLTSDPRPDVSSAIGSPNSFPGFCVPKEEIQRLAHLAILNPDVRFDVEVGTTSHFLPRSQDLPTLASMITAIALEQRRSTQLEDDCLELLSRTQQEAKSIATSPLRPFAENRSGFIEAICTEDQDRGLIWFVGWAFETDFRMAPVVLVDGRKYNGAVLACCHPRGDLPEGASGLIGVLQTPWRFRQMSRPTIYFGPSPRKHLSSLDDLGRISKQDVLSYVDSNKISKNQTGWSELRSILTGAESWINFTGAHQDVRIGVDRLIYIAAYGFLLTGWVLSYTKAFKGFALKVGMRTMVMDPASLAISSRPDLVSAFPECEGMTQGAGFTCLCPGIVPNFGSEAPLIKVLFDDGTSTVQRVECLSVRRLGETVMYDILPQLYPGVEAEAFFPSLAAAIRHSYRIQCERLEILHLSRMKKALIVAMPLALDDCYLVLEELQFNASRLFNNDTGLIIIIGSDHKHYKIRSLIKDLFAKLGTISGLISVPRLQGATYALRSILLTSGTTRFCFMAPDNIPTQKGWESITSFMGSDRDAMILEAIDPESLLPSKSGTSSFGCNWSNYLRISRHLKVTIDVPPSPMRFLAGLIETSEDFAEGAAFILRKPHVSGVVRLLNEEDSETSHDV